MANITGKIVNGARKIVKDCVLITDVGSVDPDDILATMLAITNRDLNMKGIISSHHYSDVRAKQIKLLTTKFGRDDIPVYVGHGIPSRTSHSEVDRKTFIKENPLLLP